MVERQFDPVSWGKMVEKLEQVATLAEQTHADVQQLKSAMNKGWGILIGVAGVVGLFMDEIVNAFKRLLGMDG